MSTTESTEQAPDVAAPLDQLLIQAAVGPLRRMLPGRAGLRFAVAAAKRPQRVASRTGDLARELGRIAIGTSEVTPSTRDRRFADPAWSGNPVLRRIVQAYLASSAAAEGIVQDLPMDWSDSERMRFAVENLIDALSPSNNPFLSPLAWKAFIDTGGKNAITGPRHLISDLSSPPRVPSMVDPTAFKVGEDIAATPGSVVLRTSMLEVIQYEPQTKKVHEVPLLVIPPTINKFYVLDLAPGRSLIEYLVSEGHQVFVVSWRNPDERHSKWGAKEYVGAIGDALDTVEEISGIESVNLAAACSGGLLSAIMAAFNSAQGRPKRIRSLSLLVTMIDQTQAGTTAAIMSKRAATEAIAQSRRRGYLDGRALSEVFAWLRPNDLIWTYWVNNYLQGKRPPKFDILFWNADSTRMSAKLHRDFVDIAMNNRLVHPGSLTIDDVEIDLRKIKVDAYVVAGSADHICPWLNCYRSAQLLGGKVRFVLSTSGHIAALVNPPGNPKASYQVSDSIKTEPTQWRRGTETQSGSWWTDWLAWLNEHAGKKVPAAETLGSHAHPPIEPAPGSYVFDR